MVSPASIVNLEMQLDEAMLREEELKKAIERIVKESADYLKDNLETISRIEG